MVTLILLLVNPKPVNDTNLDQYFALAVLGICEAVIEFIAFIIWLLAHYVA